MSILQTKQTRNASIEILKIIAIFAIVINHVVQTLTSPNGYVLWNDYLINISMASWDITKIILLILRTFGVFGNLTFFICSAWFLLDNDELKWKKEIKMLIDIWCISVMICIVVLFMRQGNIATGTLIKQFLPTLFANNWYMTCYLLFYPLHVLINKLIKTLSQRELLLSASLASIMYIILDYIYAKWLFPSLLILWVTIYLDVAYLKKYMNHTMNKLSVNIALVLIGMIGNAGIIVITNILGMKFTFVGTQVMHWHNNCSPFILMMAIGLFNIFRNINIRNEKICYISRLSLFIYVIHENELLRLYYRPYLWHWVYNKFGYQYVLIWILILSVAVFIFGVVMSIVYHKTLERITEKKSVCILNALKRLYLKYEDIIKQYN